MSMDYESTKYSGIAWLSGVYVPLSPQCPNLMCPSMRNKEKKYIILCAIYNLNVLKD